MDQARGTTKASFLRAALALVVVLVFADCGGVCGAWGQENYRTLYRFNGDVVAGCFGLSVAGAGDVNRDGYADVIVGGPRPDSWGSGASLARVFSGKDGAILHTFNGNIGDNWFGGAVSGAGDVNGDGYADVIVGASGDDNTGRTDSGSARVFSGKDGAILYTFNGDSGNDRFGGAVSGAGDVNGDGHADVIVGASGDDNNSRTDSGSARVLSGKNGSILYTFNGDGANDSFGVSVSGAGDVNGDGYADVIVGAHFADSNGRTNSGSARVFSGRDGAILYTFNGDGPSYYFGISVSGAGDVNGDGKDDVIVGASNADTSAVGSGTAQVFSGEDGSVLHSLVGDRNGDYFGHSVSGAGDVNGDGHPDILVGAFGADNYGQSSGSASVFSGYNGAILYTFYGRKAHVEFGRSVSGAGDVNGDGIPDVIVGAYLEQVDNSTVGSAFVFIDDCPNDANKGSPGQCGCGVADTDTDKDGTADCNDQCPGDAGKTSPGQCGCGVADIDTDKDGTADCNDFCPNDPTKTNDKDSDSDGTLDCNDLCPDDSAKLSPGACGCGIPDTDTDKDGTADCNDQCPNDSAKTIPGQCGCGTPDTDTDNDGTADCNDSCPNDAAKIAPGQCGCGTPDTDTDDDGTADCNDQCSADPYKTAPGDCGCGYPDLDSDGDGRSDCSQDPLIVPSIVSPTNGESTSAPAITVTGEADPSFVVELYVDGVFAGTSTAKRDRSWKFEFPAALAHGEKTITVRGKKGDAFTDYSKPVVVTINTGITTSKMYWVEGEEIRRSDTNGANVETLIAGMEANFLVVSPKLGQLFFTTVEGDLYKANLDGSSVSKLVTGGADFGVDVDETRSKIYWAHMSGPKIQRASLDGSDVETIITQFTGNFPRDLAVDEQNGKIYYSQQNGVISRANLDGSGIEDILTGLKLPHGIEIAGGKLFFSEINGDTVKMAELDGSAPRLLYNESHPLRGTWDLALDPVSGRLFGTVGRTSHKEITHAPIPDGDVHDLSVRFSSGVQGFLGGLDFLTIFRDKTGPVVTVPSNYTTTTDTTPQFFGFAAPDGIVRFYDGDKFLGAATVSPEGRWVYNQIVPISGGRRVIIAKGYDAKDTFIASSPELVLYIDVCPLDSNKLEPGQCGCGNPDTDTDKDGTADCNDTCKDDPNKTAPGVCGCGFPDNDKDSNDQIDCSQSPPVIPEIDNPDLNNSLPTAPQLGGKADPSYEVEVLVNGVVVGSVKVGIDGAWSFTLPNKLSPGVYFVSVRAKGTGGTSATSKLIRYTIRSPLARSFIFFADTNRNTVERTYLDGGGRTTIVSDLDKPQDVSVDPNTGMIYWTESGAKKVRRANSDGSGVQDLVTISEEPSSLGGLALDADEGKVYFADSATRKIHRASLDGSNMELLLDATAVQLALDLVGKKIYWLSASGTMSRSNLDGSDVENLISGLSRPQALAIDQQRSKLYISEVNSDRIIQCELDGSNIKEVLTNPDFASGVWDIAVADDRLFFTDQGLAELRSMPLGASAADLIRVGPLERIAGLAVHVDREAPGKPFVLSPVDSAVVDTEKLEIAGAAEPGNSVEVVLDAKVVGRAVANSEGNWKLALIEPLSIGKHTLAAVAVDIDGNRSARSEMVSFTLDFCPNDSQKDTPGLCGCGVSDQDSDRDGVVDCKDACASDALKVAPGQCGCGKTDDDRDRDGTADCVDLCPDDPNRTTPGAEGCGAPTIGSVGPTPTPVPVPQVPLLNPPRVKVSKAIAQVSVIGMFGKKDRITFVISGTGSAKLRGRKIKTNRNGTTQYAATFTKLRKGSYRATWEWARTGAAIQSSSGVSFFVK